MSCVCVHVPSLGFAIQNKFPKQCLHLGVLTWLLLFRLQMRFFPFSEVAPGSPQVAPGSPSRLQMRDFSFSEVAPGSPK